MAVETARYAEYSCLWLAPLWGPWRFFITRVVTGLRPGTPRKCGLIPGWGKTHFLFSKTSSCVQDRWNEQMHFNSGSLYFPWPWADCEMTASTPTVQFTPSHDKGRRSGWSVSTAVARATSHQGQTSNSDDRSGAVKVETGRLLPQTVLLLSAQSMCKPAKTKVAADRVLAKSQAS
jgi:hypothetical protein